MKFSQVLKNKVVFYLASRYITYAIQFVSSLVIAAKLGPYYMGIWGFILLIIQYFQQIHFGIVNSFNVLYVHHRDNEQDCNNYIVNSLLLISYLALIVVGFYLYYIIVGIKGFYKYSVDGYITWICLIAVLQYFVQFFITLFRVKNMLTSVIFCQSIIVFLNFVCIFFVEGEKLIQWLVVGYVVGNLLCVILAFMSGSIPNFRNVNVSISCQKEILKKGLYLFLYNSCFYFIIISIRTIISGHYTVGEFGTFTFSFTLAHAILLLLEALAFIIFPKVIGLLSSSDKEKVAATINMLRSIYITSAHLLIYIALICFPFLLWFFPKYEGALAVLNFIALTILMNYNSYGYLDFLIAQNKEKTSAFLSFGALIVNCTIALLGVVCFHWQYEHVILATLVTYLLFSATVVFFACRLLKQNFALEKWFPVRLMIPYITALLISFYQLTNYIFIPLFIFILLNWQQMQEIKTTASLLLKQPDKINL